MMPVMASDVAATLSPRFPGFGPVGSVYQPTAYFPTNQNANVIAQSGVPPSSNFRGISFPPNMWNSNYNPGNPLAIYGG